ncbi:hypothetical protein XENTR_v10007785 [Xenopus tropicalis]|nr:hypothetical protein XENTR_v10007785 [Xenopus tropicalis]
MGLWELKLSPTLLLWVAMGVISVEISSLQPQQESPTPGDIAEIKCGTRPEIDAEPDVEFTSRIVGGGDAAVGGQPWTVSLQLNERHICGGSIVRKDMVVTAAHCVYPVTEKKVSHMTVIAGEYDQQVNDSQEQSIPVSRIEPHPDYRGGGKMSYDIALIFLAKPIVFGSQVQPICLPQVGEKLEIGTLCVSSGWGRLEENGELSPVLQEVKLPIIGNATCSSVLESMGLPLLDDSMLCAGFPEGGRDACQGDSGGPLVCRRRSGVWFLAGCVSWGVGCGRIWGDKKTGRTQLGSPAIYSRVSSLLEFLRPPKHTEGCSSTGRTITGNNGTIKFPLSSNYSINSVCRWTLVVKKAKMMEIRFLQLDIEDHATCNFDYLSFTANEKTIRKVCGSIIPSPLIVHSNQVIVTFFSDGTFTGRGFEIQFLEIQTKAAFSCGSAKVFKKKGMIYSPNYPEPYPSLVTCNWIIKAPENNVVKLKFEDFNVEYGNGCVYDSVEVYDGTEETLLIARLCGYTLPLPVFSPGNTMLIRFKSDMENNYPGFKAKFNFVLKNKQTSPPVDGTTIVSASQPRAIPVDVCGMAPMSQKSALPRIIGGEEACPNCWPWQVRILFLKAFHCGGAIISPQWVLTAAHCIRASEPSYWVIVAGDHDRMLNESMEQIRNIKAIRIHEDYNSENYDNDIALLYLEEPLEFNDFLRPVCLPEPEEALTPTSLCVVTGWGNTAEGGQPALRLQQLHLPILDSKICNESYYPGQMTNHMLCAGFPSSKAKDACQGDSGGPLVCGNTKEQYFIYGLVSWGEGCGQVYKPGVYTKVRLFLTWIQKAQQDLQQESGPPNSKLVEQREGKAAKGCSSEALVKELVGLIASPGYPYAYIGGSHCSWVIEAEPFSTIKLTLKDLATEESEGCRDEFLAIYLDDSVDKKVTLCGSLDTSLTYFSSARRVRLRFQSGLGGISENKGFFLQYWIYRVQVPDLGSPQYGSSCSDKILTSNKGIIESPNYPDNYHDDLHCQWRVIAPVGKIIRLDLQDLKTEKDASGCQDRLLVYNGIGECKSLLGDFCGDIGTVSFKSEASEITLIFTSNSQVTRKGFSLNYSFWDKQAGSKQLEGNATSVGCPSLDLLRPESMEPGSAKLESPNFPNLYPNGMDCQWIMYSKYGKKLQVQILYLNLEDSLHCAWDYLNIYDGPNNGSHLLASLCGHKKNLIFQSSGTFVTLHFHSDKSVVDWGFKIKYGSMPEPSVDTLRSLDVPDDSESGQQKAQCGNTTVDPMMLYMERSVRIRNLNQGGKEIGRVVGGQQAAPRSWPWLVSIQNNKKKHYCGGIIIANKWILTAAHCEVKVGSHRVVVGHTDLLEVHNEHALVINSHVHELYVPKSVPPTNDLLLLELDTPLHLNNSVAVICLPDGVTDWTHSECLVAGWGITNVEGMIFPTQLQQAKGDSGGPLICKMEERYYLVGVVSWGSSECNVNAPGVYTLTSAFMDWISQHMDT